MSRRLPLFIALLSFAVSQLALAGNPRSTSWMNRQPDEARVERVLNSLTLREKAAQLLLAYPQLDKDGPVIVGGVLYVGGTLKKLKQAKERIASARERAKIPPFFAVDIEGGNFNRLKSHPSLKGLPSARELAAMKNAEVEAWGRKIARAMQDVGLNMNLSPVFDVSGSGHMFRNGRSFAGDEQVVREKAAAFARGMAKGGVIPIGKHFPGYGELDSDSDHESAIADWKSDKVKQYAAVFRAADKWLGGVMMSNVVYSAFGDKPAILEPKLVAMTHESSWLAVTDDVAIQSLADQIGAEREEVVRQAFLAGNDLILTTEPPDWSGGLDYLTILTELAQKDPANQKLLDDACRRVLRLKDRMGMLDAFSLPAQEKVRVEPGH